MTSRPAPSTQIAGQAASNDQSADAAAAAFQVEAVELGVVDPGAQPGQRR